MEHIYTYRDDSIYCHHTIDKVPEPEDFPIHAHESLEIFYFISGCGSYLVEGTCYSLHPGDIMIMRQAETHKLMISPDEPYERIAIHFPPELVSRFDEKLLSPFMNRPLGYGNLYSFAQYPGLNKAFENFDFSGAAQQRAHIAARLMLFLAGLNDVYDAQGRTGPAESFPSRLVSYVNEHLFEDISVQSISQHFMKSSSQISRDFRRSTGSSLWEYVVLKRLLAAQALMQRGEAASKVCVECGFGDYSAFYRAYRARFGHAPSLEPIRR